MAVEFDRSAHDNRAPAALLWELMPLDKRQEFCVAADISSVYWNRFVRREWAFIELDHRIALLRAFGDWNTELKDLRTEQWAGKLAPADLARCKVCGHPI